MRANRMQVAIGRIVTREPFFASILLGMDIHEDQSIPTFGTNGLCIKYNPKFASTLTDEELIGVLVHEIEHVARLHPWRRNGRDLPTWNKATDYVINEELEKSQFTLPSVRLRESRFDGLAEEQVYSTIHTDSPPGNGGSNPPQGQGNGEPDQSGKPQPGQADPSDFGSVEDCPGTEAEKHEAEQRAKVEIIRAAQIAKAQGKLPASMASYVETIKHPKVPWQDILRDFLSAYARDDYSWSKPNKRYMDTGFILPSLHSSRCGTIAIAIDTSGSIGQNEFDQFIGEVASIAETMKPEKILLIQCDAQIQDYKECDSPAELTEGKIELCGGGGTNFQPVFSRIDESGEDPAVLVYLTDAYGTFPDQEPSFPVIWAVTTDEKVPFGQQIKVELTQ